jgi:hypothetical protein
MSKENSYIPASELVGKKNNPANPSKRNGKFSGLLIVGTLDANPRKRDTFGYRSFALILGAGKSGISYEDFRAKGGRDNDLTYDLDRSRVVLKDSKGAVVKGKEGNTRFHYAKEKPVGYRFRDGSTVGKEGKVIPAKAVA